jgi:hypothetical protein
MSDIDVTLKTKTQYIPIKYAKTTHGFSDPNNETSRYLFELVINGLSIGKKYFRNLEESKYSHLIKLNHRIQLAEINSYKASVSIYPTDLPMTYELEGQINKDQSSSTQRSDNVYIEFTKNDMGYAMCSCFYTGLDHNKIFASPPN